APWRAGHALLRRRGRDPAHGQRWGRVALGARASRRSGGARRARRCSPVWREAGRSKQGLRGVTFALAIALDGRRRTVREPLPVFELAVERPSIDPEAQRSPRLVVAQQREHARDVTTLEQLERDDLGRVV